MVSSALTDIIEEAKEIETGIEKVKCSDVNNYIVELIRISEKYRFHAKIRKIKRVLEVQNKEQKEIFRIDLDEKVSAIKGEDEKEETKQYLDLKDEQIVEVSYDKDRIIVKNIVYKAEKPKVRLQELWEKEGFYQERPAIAKVKVQLWPEHLPYDHFKRKRAFLFC